MQRNAIKNVSDVIKAHTTEKSLDELRAQGKKRVRVVSGQRVMEIIQAIVDDTIDSEVGEISKRDRNRIVRDTRERFDRVLKMQTDLETKVSDLRGELRESDLERERLKADKGFLEQQLDGAKKSGGDIEPEAVMRLGRDISRLREAVDDIHRRTATQDDAAIGRAVDRLVKRDDVNAKRMATELDDVRQRLDAVGRDAARSSEKMLQSVLDRVADQQMAADKHMAERLDREFSGIHERIADLRERAENSSAGSDAIDGLTVEFDRLENRMREVEGSSTNLVAEISNMVLDRLAERDGAFSESQSASEAAQARGLDRIEKRIFERLSEESAEIARSMEELSGRVGAIDERTGNAVEAVAERVAERVVIDESALTDAVARVASRVDSRIDEIKDAVTESDEKRGAEVKALRDDMHVAAADRTALDEALAHSAERSDERLDAAVTALREEFSERHQALADMLSEGVGRLDGQVAALAERSTAADESLASAMTEGFGSSLESALQTALGTALGNAMDGVREEILSLKRAAAETSSTAPEVIGEMLESSFAGVHREIAEISTRTAATEVSLAATLEGAIKGMREELEALAQHSASRAERQDEALQSLRDEIAAQAVAQAGAASKGFGSALDEALDKITRTMESATARPIEISVEATDVLLDKIFDAGDDEMKSNLGQLDVEESTSGKGIKGSLGKLRALHRSSNGKAKKASTK